MNSIRSQTRERAKEYFRRMGLQLEERLGFGLDGEVYSANRLSAVKALDRSEQYLRERDVFLRIEERGSGMPPASACRG